MKIKIIYQGKVTLGEWRHFKWSVEINGELFEYRTGLGHATRKVNRFGDRLWHKPSVETISTNDEWIHIPKIDDILHCLFMDAQSGSESFDDFCDNLGYSNDSLKALDMYRSCADSAKRLRKALANEYTVEHERIEALEL